jgi:hypothetical protein
MSEEPPNINFGSPVIFFDSHPEEQESYLYSYWTALKGTFHIAFTGIVPPFHHPGTIRIIWYTVDGNQGLKDYELHEYALVRKNFDVLLAMDEIHRVVVMGYSGQNPYILVNGRNPFVDRFQREGRRSRRAKMEQMKAEETEEQRVKRERETREKLDSSKEGRTGVLVDIESLIAKHDKAEEERLDKEEERIWMENEGLLSGEMV